MPLENILSDLTAEIKALRLTIAAGMKAPAAFTVETAAAAPVAAPAPINSAPIEAAAPTAEAAPVQSEAAAPVSDTVAADQAPAAAESAQTPAKTEQKTTETQAEKEKTDKSGYIGMWARRIMQGVSERVFWLGFCSFRRLILPKEVPHWILSYSVRDQCS